MDLREKGKRSIGERRIGEEGGRTRKSERGEKGERYLKHETKKRTEERKPKKEISKKNVNKKAERGIMKARRLIKEGREREES